MTPAAARAVFRSTAGAIINKIKVDPATLFDIILDLAVEKARLAGFTDQQIVEQVTRRLPQSEGRAHE